MRFAAERGVFADALRFAALNAALGVAAVLASGTARAQTVEIAPGTKAGFASAAEGGRLLSDRDVFVAAMSPFDRAARLKTDRDVTETEYLAFVARQTLEWTDTEAAALTAILERFRKATADLDLRLPPVVLFVKTTGLEEGRAAYCRGASVVLPVNVVGGDAKELEKTVFHELFHIFSRHHPERRAALYRILGFEVCPEIALPESLRNRKITNPDAPLLDSVVRVRVNGERRPVAPLLLARTERYDVQKGGEFFDSMDFRLLVVVEEGGRFRPAARPDGKPWLLEAERRPRLPGADRREHPLHHSSGGSSRGQFRAARRSEAEARDARADAQDSGAAAGTPDLASAVDPAFPSPPDLVPLLRRSRRSSRFSVATPRSRIPRWTRCCTRPARVLGGEPGH